MMFVWYLSSLPNESLVPERGLGFKVDSLIKHFVEFGILGILSLNFFYQAVVKKNSFLPTCGLFSMGIVASLIAIFFGVIDEIHQCFVPTRFCTLSDMAVNAVGGMVGVLFFVGFVKFYNHQFSALSRLILHTFGLSTLAGAVFLEGLVFFDIVTSGMFVACEHNIYILTSEVILSGVSFMYFGYLWFRLLKGNL
jgi:hypothetical protein